MKNTRTEISVQLCKPRCDGVYTLYTVQIEWDKCVNHAVTGFIHLIQCFYIGKTGKPKNKAGAKTTPRAKTKDHQSQKTLGKREKMERLKEQKKTIAGRFEDQDGYVVVYGHPIKFFVTTNEKGNVMYQGFIDAVNPTGGGNAVFFSAFSGEMNTREVVTPDFIANAILFDNEGAMRHRARQ